MKHGLWIFFLLACAVSKPVEKGHFIKVEMDPLVITKKGGQFIVESQNFNDLFKKAGLFYDEKRFALSIRIYQQLLQTFPENRHIPLVYYNMAITHEALNQIDKALATYQTILARFPKSTVVIDTRFKIAGCYQRLGKLQIALKFYARILRDSEISGNDFLEASVLMGNIFQQQKALQKAKQSYQRGLRYFHRLKIKKFLNANWVAALNYQLGEVLRKEFSGQPIRLPEKIMKQDMEKKGYLFLSAQRSYIKALIVKDNYWSVAAGFRLAEIYSTFYEQILTSPIPDKLTPLERRIYIEELKKKIHVLYEKSVWILEQNITMCEQREIRNIWLNRTQKRLKELKDRLRVEISKDLDRALKKK